MSDGRDYAVGYGKPPRHSRWPKGVSGNPKGRKKGSRGLKTDLDAELKQTVEIRINGRKVKGTTQRMMIRTLAIRGASGDVRAGKLLLDLILQIFGPGDRGGEAEQLSDIDRQLLDQLLSDVTTGKAEDSPNGRDTPGKRGARSVGPRKPLKRKR